MKKTTKLLSIVLVVTMLIGIIPMSAVAMKIYGVGDIVTDDPVGVTFGTPLEVGVKYEGEIQGDEPFVEVSLSDDEEWFGYAKSFTVTLDEYTNYQIQVHVEGDDAVYVDRAIAVYYEGQLGLYVTDWADPGNSLDLSLDFQSYLSGEYQILVWGYCCDEEDNDLFDSTYVSVLIGSGLDMMGFSTTINPDEEKEITLDEDDPYFYESGCYGNGFGFNTNLTQGKYYEISVSTMRSEDIISHDLSPSLALAEYKDGELTDVRGGYGIDFSYIVPADRTGKYEFLFFGETWDSTDEKYIYGDLFFYTISVKELDTFYFDIDNEDEYIEFIDELYFRSYEGCAVVATINANLDLVGNEYYYGIDTNASLLVIEGVGNTTIEGITEPIVEYASTVYIDYITVKGNLYYTETGYDVGLLVGYADNAVINNCGAIGFIDFDGATYVEDVGGVAGQVNYLTVNNTEVMVDITADGVEDFEYVGGLAGYCMLLTVNNAEVMVDITADGVEYFEYVGGICGYSNTMNASNVSYIGDIVANAPDSFYCVGGFVGDAEYDSVFENCTVEGEIRYDGTPTTIDLNVYAVGGFAGYLEDYNVFNNCNTNVTVRAFFGECVGGFAGYVDEANEFYNCYAAGQVTGSYAVGGFVGYSNCCGYNNFVNCYADSFVNGKDEIGGFIGCTYEGDTFVNCYAYSDVMCIETETEDTYIGTFAGYVPYENTFISVYVQGRDKYSVIGPDAYEDLDVSEIQQVDFKNDDDVDAVVDALNDTVDAANENGTYKYKLLNWSSDNEDGIPKFAEKPAYIVGDANLDNKVDSVDYLLVKRHCFKTYTLEGDALKAANVNGDEVIDSTDYLLVKRICFGTYKA